MQIRKIKRLKKSGTLALAAMMTVLSMNTTAFAGSTQYVSEEGIGIEVHNPGYSESGISAASEIVNGDSVIVSGGKLWTTWYGGSLFRANYYHASKLHRCSVTNDHGERLRSDWTEPGVTAISPWLAQTLTNNRSWAATE